MTRSRRRRRTAVVGFVTVALTAGLIVMSPTAGASSREVRLLDLINGVRRSHDLRAVRLDARLAEEAERHTGRMIALDSIFDPPNLAQLLRPYDWRRVAGSVAGCATSLRGLVRTWMSHAEHREVLLLRGVRRAGLGVKVADGQSLCGRDGLWSTGILYG